jgi:hypothetical protein
MRSSGGIMKALHRPDQHGFSAEWIEIPALPAKVEYQRVPVVPHNFQ